MITIYDDVEQGTAEWLKLRLGIPTASEFDCILTPQLAVKKGKALATYTAAKIAETWTGVPRESGGSHATEQGTMSEMDARNWLELVAEIDVRQVAFVRNERCGCSPDGLIGDDAGLEIKCPEAHTHTKYLIAGTLPDEHAHQVHGSLYVTGRKRWHFLSYRDKFPPLFLTIERDEEIMANIKEALEGFYAQYDAGLARLKQLNAEPLPTL